VSLAYVFWHWPGPDGEPAAYEERLLAFQRTLGRPGTQTYRLDRAPWDTAPPGPLYEDWYPVADWADLGRLNDEAVSGRNLAPHDAVAHMARTGAGGVYRRIAGEHDPSRVGFSAWVSKPVGETYENFAAQLRELGATVWQRQMVLGPAPEFALLGAEPLSLAWPAATARPAPL
jgi:hypothetical protein